VCHDPSARPPLPPNVGGAPPARTERLVLEAPDGNRFSAYGAKAAGLAAPGVVVLPDVRGLHPFYEDLATRLADTGAHAIAIDYFGRTAGLEERGPDFDFMQHVAQTNPRAVALDVEAAVARLRSNEGGPATALYTIGFCFGGRHSFNQAARHHGLAGVIGFYGVVQQRDRDDFEAPILRAPDYECPVLGLFGGADQAISSADVGTFREALDAAGVRNKIVIYEGAPHSFFDRTYEQHRAACDDAWKRILAFIGLGTA
jgi:carboxymethylenebutenolidase